MCRERLDLVFFDMDHTLIDHDCDVSWKEFMIDKGLAAESERSEIQRYFDLYLQGALPIEEFLEFQLEQMRGLTVSELAVLTREHFYKCVTSRFFPQALELIQAYKDQGIPVVILTATNEAVAGPVAEFLQMDALIATQLEIVEGLYTGRIVEPFCIAQGKVALGSAYCKQRSIDLQHVLYFGDSSSDIPMMEAVGHQVMINPLGSVRSICEEKKWPIRQWSL